jgi:hypothetical protein
MFKNLTKPLAAVSTVLGAIVLSACGNVEAPPAQKIEIQYRSLVSGRYIGRYSELQNLKITNVRCKIQDIFMVCTIDATGDLYVRNSLEGTVDTKRLDERNVELKFFNRDALRK